MKPPPPLQPPNLASVSLCSARTETLGALSRRAEILGLSPGASSILAACRPEIQNSLVHADIDCPFSRGRRELRILFTIDAHCTTEQ